MAPLLAACAHRPPPSRPLGPDIGGVLIPDWGLSRSNPGDPDSRSGPAGRLRAGGVRFTASPPQAYRRSGAHALEEQPRGDSAGPFVFRRRHAAEKAPPSGAPPDDGDPSGRPAAERPDRMTALPTTGQPRYFSPAALKGYEDRRRPPEPLAEPEAFGDGKVSDGLSAARASFAPAATAFLDDAVPETGVDDPKSLGSYRIQVAFAPDFHKVLYDRTYPFMAEIDLASDLVAARTRSGIYWIRWSLVDLLEFQHPFTRPQRVKLDNPRLP